MVAATLLCSALLAAQPRLAVLDVRAGVGISPELARGLSEALTHEVRRRNPDTDVLGAAEIRAMLEVQTEKSRLGCQDVSCLAEIGGALGASQIVTAGLNKFGDTYLFTVQLVDVRRAHVMRDGQERFAGSNQGELLVVVERAVAKIFPGGPASASSNPSRISLIYDPEIPITSNALSAATVIHSIGAELSVPSGGDVRYHLQLAYVAVDGLSGVRVDPLTFGWAIPIVVQGQFRLEIEPTIAFLDALIVFDDLGSGQPAFFLSSGLGVQVNIGYGPIYAFVSPVGFEVRYFGLVPQPNADDFGDDTGGFSEHAVGGADLSYRLRFGIGFQY